MTNLNSIRDTDVEGRTVRAPRATGLDWLFDGATGRIIALIGAGGVAWGLLSGNVQQLLQRDAQSDGGVNGRVSLLQRRADDADARLRRLEDAQSGVYDRLTRIEMRLESGATQTAVDQVLKEIRDWRRDADGRVPRR